LSGPEAERAARSSKFAFTKLNCGLSHLRARQRCEAPCLVVFCGESKRINFAAKQNIENKLAPRRRARACVCVDYMLNLVIGVRRRCIRWLLYHQQPAPAHLIKHPRVLRRTSKLAARRGLIADMDYLSQKRVPIQLGRARLELLRALRSVY
jgi:hypothetical protein